MENKKNENDKNSDFVRKHILKHYKNCFKAAQRSVMDYLHIENMENLSRKVFYGDQIK